MIWGVHELREKRFSVVFSLLFSNTCISGSFFFFGRSSFFCSSPLVSVASMAFNGLVISVGIKQ